MTAVELDQIRDTPHRPISGGWVSTGLWLVVMAAVLAAGLTPVTTGALAGNDDYMRFVRVFAWLDGTGWYDQVVERLNAPHGAVVPWSRLVDLPLAALITILAPMIGRPEAAMIAATVVPALLLLALMKSAILLSRPVTGGRAALLGAVIAVLLPNLVTAMMPGRVDHHTWQLALMALATASLAYALADPNRARPALAAGGLFGLSMWVGGETVPWLAVANAALGLLWIVDGQRMARVGRNLGVGLVAVCLGAFPFARAPDLWFVPACDAFSLATIGLAFAVLGFWVVISAIGRRTEGAVSRAGLGGICAIAVGGAWLAAFPSCADGPYGDIDPRLVERWLHTVSEAQSLPGYAMVRPGTAAAMTLSPLIGCIAAITAAFTAANKRRRRVWVFYATLILSGLALAVWQIRVLPFANLFAIAPLAWLVANAWRAIDRHMVGFGTRLTKVLVLLAVGPLGTAFGAFDTLKDQRDTAASAGSDNWSVGACDLSAVAHALPQHQFGKPAVVAAPVDLGAELLFRTPHGVIGAPYHRNADGILDSQALFGATDADQARQILDARGATYLVTCPGISEMQLYQGSAGRDTFAERLASGNAPPWLTPVAVPAASGVLVYRVSK